jgi:hypothetical protein
MLTFRSDRDRRTSGSRIALESTAVRYPMMSPETTALLDSLWKEVGDLANLPHHPEGAVAAQTFDARDAELVLLLTAAVSTYLGPR